MWSWFLNLFGLGKPTAARMARRLQSQRPEDRREALATLATLPDPWVIEVLLPLLGSTDGELRDGARAQLLARGAAIVPAVGRRIDLSDEATSRRLVDLLAELREASAVHALLQGLKYSARPIQIACKQALSRCGPVAIAPLEAASNDENPWIRKQIEEILTALNVSG